MVFLRKKLIVNFVITILIMNECVSSNKSTDIEEGISDSIHTTRSEEIQCVGGELEKEESKKTEYIEKINDYLHYLPSSHTLKDYFIQVSSSVTSGLILYMIYKSNN